jgi:hypothetical protein
LRILTVENNPYELDSIPEEIEDIRYCVLDCSDKHNIDFYFLPLIFLESFHSPAIVLEIGKHTIKMPLDWSIVVCDEDYGDLEIMPLTKLNDRGFHSLLFNPLEHMVPASKEITISNVYADVKWYFPKLKNGNILVVPVEGGEKPLCALFVKEGAKIQTPIDIATLFQ